MLIIDAHVHLWDKLTGDISGKPIRNQQNGIVDFGGSFKQMMPPYMLDGRNTAELLISNMDYAGVSSAVITQEYIDGLQNSYLTQAMAKYPNRLFAMGMVEFRQDSFYEQIKTLITSGFKGIKIPAEKLANAHNRYTLTTPEFFKVFQLMADNNIILSIDLDEGSSQVAEMNEIISSFPTLKIAIGHFGMVNRPHWQEQIKLAKNENVYIESGGITWLFHKEFYPYHGAIQAIQTAIDLVGEDKLMWGSDYPRTMTEITYKMSYDFITKSTDLSEQFKGKFLGKTAQKFYNFEHITQPKHVESILD